MSQCVQQAYTIKLIREVGPTSTDTLVQDHKLQTKEFCILWTITPHHKEPIKKPAL